MATTRESLADLLRWCREVLTVFVRRAAILGFLAALFAVAVIFTTRERISDCTGVTEAQRSTLASLGDPSTTRSFLAEGSPSCVDGAWTVPLQGVADTMERVTRQLAADGWTLETEFLPHFDHLWRRCFRFPDPGWERIQITVDATRAGAVDAISATAPEQARACDLERRRVQPVQPPTGGDDPETSSPTDG